MSWQDLQWQSWQWLLLIPFLWLFLIFWYQHFQKKSSNLHPSIVDIDLSASNHFYHPLAGKLITASQQLQSTSTAVWKKADFWFYGVIFSLLLSALAQPILIGKRLPDPPPEHDIVFLVDVSVSMQLADYQQQQGDELQAIKRIEVLRQLLDDFTSNMRGEKISVVLFAEQAYVLVPLSNDQNLIHNMLSRISTTLAGRYTAVGDALLMALNESLSRLRTNQASGENKRHQTFILFTDADASRGKVSAIAAAKVIAEHDIPVFTIAIGSSNTANTQATQVEGGLYQAVDLALLENIAKQTKGENYQVSDAKSLQEVLQTILKQRQNIATPTPLYETRQLFSYPLMFALLLLMLFQLYRLYKTGSRANARQCWSEATTTRRANKMSKTGGGVH